MNRCQVKLKYARYNQQTPLLIESMKEIVAYALANDPSYDFFLKEYFVGARIKIARDVRDGKYEMAENRLFWKALAESEKKVKRDFAAKMGNSGHAGGAADEPSFEEFVGALPADEVYELLVALDQLLNG